MANELSLDTGDLVITDNADVITLSDSNIYDDVILYRLSLKQVFTINSSIKQVVDFTKGL